MKKWGLRFCSAAAPVIWLCVIGVFSGQNGEESESISDVIVRMLQKILPLPVKTDTLSLLIRKGAHMTEFAILTALLLWFFMVWFGWRLFWRGLAAWGMTAVFASCDELHQTFVDGRYGCVTDVLIDLAGATLFLLLFFGIRWVISRKTKKRKA